ncbi:MAG: large conductance mechanosensitive channel protein MscL [Dehalococcoidales bacterium]|nr:large conductance mechanosensitive channel protein MscL [Dehalococcoidales bacterium]
MLKDFKAFIMRGNVVDMAVGIIIGAAFGPIVNSFVKDVIMPPIGLALGKVDFANLFVVLKEGKEVTGPYASLSAAQAAGAISINYGFFINTIINFIIIAAVVFFFVVRPVARMNAKQQAPAAPAVPTTKQCPYCYTTINLAATRCPNCTSDLTARK